MRIAGWLALLSGLLAVGIVPGFCAGNSGAISEELDAEYTYVGAAGMHGSGMNGGYTTENASDLKYVISEQLNKDFLLRTGVEWQRFSFDSTRNSFVPGVLQQVSGVLGFDDQLGDQWLVRVEVEPGVYSDFANVDWRSFDVPLVIGGAYLAADDLQWFFGMRVDAKCEYPVLPAAGFRWRCSENWTVNFQLPHPKLEYEFNQKWHGYLGAEVQAGTYQVGNNFGIDHGEPKLDHGVVDYMEFRVGPGLSWKCSPYATIAVDGGYTPYRQFDFFRHDDEMISHGGFYGEITCNASF
jgi:hypothetical protein